MATKKMKERKRRARKQNAVGHPTLRARTSYGRIEIYDEPKHHHRSEHVQDLHERAVDLLSRNDGVGAERLLKEALELEPDACELHNNLCAAYELQGRCAEAVALVREIHDRNPHYFVGRTNLARLCINEGGLERAGRLIEPLFKQRRMHVTEFAALSSAYIHLRLAQGDVNAARDWFEIWSELTPGIPAQELWRRDLAHTPLAWLRRRVLFRRRPD